MSQAPGDSKSVLAVVQTPRELAWAAGRAAASPRESWTILCLGDAESAPRTDSDAVARCRFISIDDIGIDASRIWRQAQELQPVLWANRSRKPSRLLHLAAQQYVFRAALGLVLQDAVISRALAQARPDEVRVPPLMMSRIDKSAVQAISELQLMVSEAALGQGFACRMPWSFRLKRGLGCLPAAVAQAGYFAYLAAYDLFRVAFWAASRARLAFTSQAAVDVPANAVLMANADFELRRHFDLGRLSPELARRCHVWMFSPPLLAPFADRLWRDRAASNKLQRRAEGAGDFLGIPEGAQAQSAFPTLAAPLILGNSRVWYNSAWPTDAPPSMGDSRAPALLRSHVAAHRRLTNWRRMAYAARYFAQACDVFRALRPVLVVTSDAHIGQRAVTLAARHCGVRSLTTLQGVLLWSEGYGDFYPLADVTCLFADTYPLLAPRDHPGLPTERIICHDYAMLARPSVRRPRAKGGPFRVMIVTSRYFPDWCECLLVNRKAYLKELSRLVGALAAAPEQFEISFKPHPTNEPHEPYLSLQRDFPDAVKQVLREPLPADAPIEADIVVFFNCTSTIFYYALQQNIPIVSHWGALTPLARRLFATAELAGSDDSVRLAGAVDEMLADPDGPAARESFDKARAVAGRFIQPALGGINEALSHALGERFQNA